QQLHFVWGELQFGNPGAALFRTAISHDATPVVSTYQLPKYPLFHFAGSAHIPLKHPQLVGTLLSGRRRSPYADGQTDDEWVFRVGHDRGATQAQPYSLLLTLCCPVRDNALTVDPWTLCSG